MTRKTRPPGGDSRGSEVSQQLGDATTVMVLPRPTTAAPPIPDRDASPH